MPGPAAKLTSLFAGPEMEVNVFVHGYRAVGSEEGFERLSAHVLAARPRGRVYLLYWKSGTWKLQGWIQAGRVAYRAFRSGKKMLGLLSLLGDGVILGAAEMAAFKLYERRAEELGRSLKQYISRIPKAKRDKLAINLIGHSLGARVIHYALATNDWSDYNLNDCVFLGGAADAEDEDWQDCLVQINGRIYNVYSKADRILKWTPDRRRRVGRHPIQSDSPRIVNREYAKLGHLDYWPRLKEILPEVWPGYRPSPHISADQT